MYIVVWSLSNTWKATLILSQLWLNVLTTCVLCNLSNRVRNWLWAQKAYCCVECIALHNISIVRTFPTSSQSCCKSTILSESKLTNCEYWIGNVLSLWQVHVEGRRFQSASESQESHKPINTYSQSTAFCFPAYPVSCLTQCRVIYWSSDSFYCSN